MKRLPAFVGAAVLVGVVHVAPAYGATGSMTSLQPRAGCVAIANPSIVTSGVSGSTITWTWTAVPGAVRYAYWTREYRGSQESGTTGPFYSSTPVSVTSSRNFYGSGSIGIAVSAAAQCEVDSGALTSKNGAGRTFAFSIPPTAPLAPKATDIGEGIAIEWQTPSDPGSSVVTKYSVVSSPLGVKCESQAVSCLIPLPKFTASGNYTFTVTATNADGTSPGAVTASVSITKTATKPAAKPVPKPRPVVKPRPVPKPAQRVS